MLAQQRGDFIEAQQRKFAAIHNTRVDVDDIVVHDWLSGGRMPYDDGRHPFDPAARVTLSRLKPVEQLRCGAANRPKAFRSSQLPSRSIPNDLVPYFPVNTFFL